MANQDKCGAGLEYENLHPFLRSAPFPASRDKIIRHAQDKGADQSLIGYLKNLPEREYSSLEDLSDECGTTRFVPPT